MKKVLLFIIPPILACILFFGFTLFMAKYDVGKGALQVTSNPTSNVYLDNKFIGRSGFCKCEANTMLPAGDHTVKLVPDDSSKFQTFEQRIKITKSVITAVDYTFGEKNTSNGSVVSLSALPDKSSAQIFVASFPSQSKMYLDKNLVGQTPVLVKDVTESDHDVGLVLDGYQKKGVLIHTVKGYKLNAVVFLGVTDPNATSSSEITLSSTPSGTISPIPTPTPTLGPNQVKILDTPTGFLRVRADATLGASETAQVKPGDTFQLLDQRDGWYEIKLSATQSGWVSNQYAQKQ